MWEIKAVPLACAILVNSSCCISRFVSSKKSSIPVNQSVICYSLDWPRAKISWWIKFQFGGWAILDNWNSHWTDEYQNRGSNIHILKNTILYVSMHNFKLHPQLCHHCSWFLLDSNMGMKMIRFKNQTPVVISHLSWHFASYDGFCCLLQLCWGEQRHTKDSVHGSANLMRDCSEKFTFALSAFQHESSALPGAHNCPSFCPFASQLSTVYSTPKTLPRETRTPMI